jgi:hypothetical protein
MFFVSLEAFAATEFNNILWGRQQRLSVKFLQLDVAEFVMFVCPSTWNNSASTGRILIKFGV